MASVRSLVALTLALALAGCSGTVGDLTPVPDADAPLDDAPLPAPPDATSDAPRAMDAVDATAAVDRPALEPCAQRANGTWCAGLLGLPSGGRLRCEGGVAGAVEPCADGCLDLPGATDACASDAVEPCFNDPDGSYCGGSIGASARRDDLYVCVGRRTARVDACASGCDDRAGGTDACRAADPCARATFGNGAYCGAGIGGDAAVLYNCQGGRTASQARCERGCEAQPPGVADRCAAAPTTGRCCLLRPPGSFVRGFSACGRGGSHYGIDSGAGLGTALVAGISGTVVGVATGHPNCPYNVSAGTCPASCVNQFNYVKIRSDCGDPSDGGRDLYVYYLHVDRLAAGIGNGVHVNQGDLIAYVGNSGCSSGPHVHLEIVPVARGASAFLNTCTSVDPASRYCS